MKVKPSVKKICEKCKTIRRHGVVMVICAGPATSSGRADRRGWRYRARMARIAGVDLPAAKRVEIGLTYIFGLGRTRAIETVKGTRVNPNTRVRDLSEEEEVVGSGWIDSHYKVEGDLRRDPAGHQAQDRDRLLPGHPAPPGPAGARPADPHQRPHPQGPKKTVAGKKEGHEEVKETGDLPPKRRSPRSPGGARRRTSRTPGRHIKSSFNQHDRDHHRPPGQHDRVGDVGQRRVQGLAQVDPVRGPARGRAGRPPGPEARRPQGRRVRQGPGLRPGRRPSAPCRPPAWRSRASRTSPRPPQRLPPAQAAPRLRERASIGEIHRP